MDVKEKLEKLKHIRLGTSEVLYYPYNSGTEPLPLRPISSWELDECFYKALEHAQGKVSELIINLKLGLIKDLKRNINVSNEGYAELLRYNNTVDFWIVYYAMKDFQEEWFSKPDFLEIDEPKGMKSIRLMSDVHEIAEFVMNASIGGEEVIKELFLDSYGREIAYCMYYLKIPLAELKNLTKLQREYVVYTRLNSKSILEGDIKSSKYVKSGEEMSMKEFLEKFK